MHFHDNLTDNQHHSALNYEVSFSSTTPPRNPSAEYIWLSGRITSLHSMQFSWLSCSKAVDVHFFLVICWFVSRHRPSSCAQASKKEQSCETKLTLCGSPGVCKIVGVSERVERITPIGAGRRDLFELSQSPENNNSHRDSNVACKWIQWRVFSTNEVQGKIGQFQKTLHLWWKRKVAKPISNIDSFVKHVYREHNEDRQITGLIQERKDEGKLSLTDEMVPQ